MCRYLFSILAICWVLQVQAQEEPPPPKKVRIDTVHKSYVPTGLRIGTDVLALIRSKDNSFKGWEINFDTDLHRYFVSVDYGYWATNQLLGNGRYTNSGHYLRFGADVNFLLKDPEKNMFFLGMRYGISSFNESVQYSNTAMYSGFGTNSYSRSNGNLSGHWIEITTGLRVKIVSGFWMGCTARLKFAPAVSGFGQLLPYDMPGYGIVEEAPYWGFNYQLFWRLPFKTK